MNEDLIKLFSIPNIVVKIPTIWLLKNSMINESILYNAHLMVRYKTIESYINNKNDWCDTYNRMQRIRVSQKAIIPREYEGVFHENDLAYLDGASPKNEIVNGDNANYRLYPPRIQNLKIAIYFERLTGK